MSFQTAANDLSSKQHIRCYGLVVTPFADIKMNELSSEARRPGSVFFDQFLLVSEVHWKKEGNKIMWQRGGSEKEAELCRVISDVNQAGENKIFN